MRCAVQGDRIAVFDAVVPQQEFLRRSVACSATEGGLLPGPPRLHVHPDARNLRLERWLMPDEENFYAGRPHPQSVGAVSARTSFLMASLGVLAGGIRKPDLVGDLATGNPFGPAGTAISHLNEKLKRCLSPLVDLGPWLRQRGQLVSGTRQSCAPLQPPPDPVAEPVAADRHLAESCTVHR